MGQKFKVYIKYKYKYICIYKLIIICKNSYLIMKQNEDLSPLHNMQSNQSFLVGENDRFK